MNAQIPIFARIKQHNAEYPRELFAAKEINRLLTNVDFPAERIWLDLRFDPSMTDPTSSTLDVMMISGEAHGIAVLRIQPLYLQQDMQTMVDEAIPHELAHILHAIDVKQKGEEIGKLSARNWLRFARGEARSQATWVFASTSIQRALRGSQFP